MINRYEIIKNARVFYEDDHVVVYDKGECLKMIDEAIRQALELAEDEIDCIEDPSVKRMIKYAIGNIINKVV